MANIAPELVIDDLAAQVDGSATTFTTQYDYIAGSVTLYANGMPLVAGNGITEIPPNTITLEPDRHGNTHAPQPWQNLWASYMA